MTDWRDDLDDRAAEDELEAAESATTEAVLSARVPRRLRRYADPDEERDAVHNGDRAPTWRCP